jgi:hypothetical protein
MAKTLPNDISLFLQGKSTDAVNLFNDFYKQYISIGATCIEATKTTIAFGEKRHCYIYQFGKHFITGVFRINDLHEDPELFFKTRKDGPRTYVHHFRIYDPADIPPLKKYMTLAIKSNE